MQNRRVAVRGIIVKDKKILCVRLNNYKGNAFVKESEYWCTPGGGVDIGEPLIPALEREMIEETGIKPVVGNLLYIQQFEHKGWEHLEFFFHITNSQDYENIDLSKSTHGALEIAEIDFVDPTLHTVLPAFLTKQNISSDAVKGITQVFNFM